ncbi:Hypp330 [Branchiostoma lanceolatum]|uniref:Hypp330 protein n=1 Tax=Branchiostoma lanceolatum TaxID=7740 RepID=A0A8J9W397_BRALA|nr:Hypp330 [Branchiostoma lanceolatum]
MSNLHGPSPVMACCFLSSLQAPVQAAIRPAMWLPGIRNLHSHKETWQSEATAPDSLKSLLSALEKVKVDSPYWRKHKVNKVDEERYRVQIFTYTRAEWLDVVDIEFRPGQTEGSEAEAASFSSGLFPTLVPLCFVLNTVILHVYHIRILTCRLECIYRLIIIQKSRLVS